MLSFIVIGQNEEINLKRCLDSIFRTIQTNQISDFEVIYVDSASTDHSIEVVSQFKDVKILELTGKCSVAAGRNAGFNESSGDIIFFIDADTELNPDFLTKVLDHSSLKYHIVFGQVLNKYHSFDGKYIKDGFLYPYKNEGYKTFPGGIFLVRREILVLINGMDTRYVNAFEDIDAGLKWCKLGYPSYFVNEIICTHFTTDYRDRKRIWQTIFSGQQLNRGVMYRNHLFNQHLYPLMLRMDYTFILLFLAIGFSVILSTPLIFIFYLSMIIVRVSLQSRDDFFDIINRIPAFILRDVLTVFSFLFYYPKKFLVQYKKLSF